MNIRETYETSDLYLIAALLCRGHCKDDIQREGQRVFYVFGSTEELRETVRDYFDGVLMVDAKEYANYIQNVKTEIFDILRAS